MVRSTYHIFFSKLSNPTRISIITSLNEKKRTVQELSEDLMIEQSKLSHALTELRACNIVQFEQQGKKRVYKLSPTIKPILKLIDMHGEKYCNIKNCRGCK